MTAVREWLLSVVSAALLLSVMRLATGEGRLGKIISFTGGLILLTALLRPLPGMDLARLTEQWERYGREIQLEMEELEDGNRAELTALIESRTAAYISEQAERLGIRIQADVTAEPGPEEIPVPAAVVLTGARSAELEAWIASELGIPAERQVWNDES